VNNAVYIATTGLLNRARALDVTANNLANAGVAGFKREELITSTFHDEVELRMEDGTAADIGAGNHGAIGVEISADISQGALETTGRTLDVAIAGDGFFAVQDTKGVNGMTRNGSFQIDANGYLTTSSGAFVLGQNGRIQLKAGTATISETGQITVNGQNAGQLLIIVPQANATLEKQANGLFTRPAGNGQFTGRILQGTLERANVDMVEEMSDMMASSRAFQSCGQVLRILDQVNQKTVNEIGRF
jgi:flagellar basal-body rod protein FlgG